METLALSGSFDFPAAKALQAMVVNAPATSAIQVDFSQVAEFNDVALAGLGAWLASQGRKVAAVGLREAELRLLTYLGFSAAFANGT
jgi:ABC-type transporter Mla MlaB component